MRFSQVDVFSDRVGRGNALAVVHDADDVTDEDMATFARWTNLSETAFLIRPTDPAADYRVRIWTPVGELPFAGHPTIGSAHAWLEAGGAPHTPGLVVQECGVGLVRLSHGDRLAFAAPPLIRHGAVDETDLTEIRAIIGLGADDIVDSAWIDNGPGWVGVLLPSAEAVLRLNPDFSALGRWRVGVVGPYDDARALQVGAAVEVRAFHPGIPHHEDPVTGSLNAGLAQWLIGSGRLPSAYVASQGAALGRDGRVHIASDGVDTWVGGDVVTCIDGNVSLGLLA